MYKKPGTTDTKAAGVLEAYIEGSRVYDSRFLYNLTMNPEVPKDTYVIGETEKYRPDLIANRFYGDVKHEGLVILQAGGIKNILPGTILNLIKKTGLDNLADK